LLQVNCRSIYNKTLDFWNLIDTYNSDVVIGTELWLSGEISYAKFLGLTTELSEETDTLGVVCAYLCKKLHYLRRAMGGRGIRDDSSKSKMEGPKKLHWRL